MPTTSEASPGAPSSPRRNWVAGPGRPKGAKNKKTLERDGALTAAATRLKELIPDISMLDAHGLLVAVYRDPEMPIAIRIEAARAALRVEKPALQTTQVSGELTLTAGIASRLAAARQRTAAITADPPVIDAVVADDQDDDA